MRLPFDWSDLVFFSVVISDREDFSTVSDALLGPAECELAITFAFPQESLNI